MRFSVLRWTALFLCCSATMAEEAAQKEPREQYRVPENHWRGPMPKLPDETKDIIYLGSSPEWLSLNDSGMISARKIRELFPDTQFVQSPVWFPTPGTDVLIRELQDIGVFYQQQHAPVADYDNLRQLAPMPRNYRGDRMKADNAVLATAPEHQAYLNSKFYQGAKYGNNNFKAVDFVWPWTGRWAYDETTVAAFRDDLKELDEGLLLTDAAGNLYREYFWDYFEFYRGVRFSPAELGYSSWNEFFPVREIDAASPNATIEEKRNLVVFLALYHYEHLRQHQRYGRAAKAVGGIQQATYNPEDFANGGDYVYILKLADFGTPFIEYFGAPVNTEGGFYHMGAYRRAADAAGKSLGVIHELGQGGHGRPSVTPLVQFVQTYDVTAMGFDQYHNEWMEADAATMMDPAQEYHNRRWRTFLGGAYGYKHARNDRARRRPPRVFSVTLRSVNHYMDAWNWDAKSMDSFCRYFSPLAIDGEEGYPNELPELLNQVDFLFYTAPYTRRSDFAPIAEWLASDPAHTLITHSYIPYSVDDGIEYQLSKERIVSAPVPDMIMGLMRFPVTTDTVIYRGENYSYADFLAEEARMPFQTEWLIAPEFAGLTVVNEPFSGPVSANGNVLADSIRVPQYWQWTPEGAEVLATIGERPLLTRLKRADGAGILYLHVRLQALPEALRQALTAVIAESVNLPRLALPDADETRSALVHAYDLADGGNAVVLWDRAELEKRGYYAGYRPEKDWEKNQYEYAQPQADARTSYLVDAPGNYRIYAVVSGNEYEATADGKLSVPLELKGQLCELFLVGQDTPEWREKLKEFKARRDVMRANTGEI